MARRKAGNGSVRLRKDGRWEGRTVIGYNEKGLPKTKNVLAKTKTECIEKLNRLKEELGANAPKPKPDLIFGEWIDFWYPAKLPPQKTKKSPRCLRLSAPRKNRSRNKQKN
jgi:hypothetical protein